MQGKCFFCIHKGIGNKCDAFPDGIPEDILTGIISHDSNISGDNGILFEESNSIKSHKKSLGY